MRVFLLALCGLLLAGAASAQMPLTEYRQLIHELRTLPEKKLSPATAADYRQRLLAARGVRREDGTRIEPDNGALIAALEKIQRSAAPAKLPETVVRQIEALENLTVSPATGAVTPDVATAVTQVFQAAEFQKPATESEKKTLWDTIQDWWQKAMETIGGWFRNLLRWLFGGTARTANADYSFVSWLLMTFAVVVVAVALSYLLRWTATRLPTRQKRAGVIHGLDLLDSAQPDPLAASKERAAQGDYRGALRLAYIACLRQLASSGMLILQENKTNWEYQRDLQNRSAPEYAILLPATRLFDQVWYGQRSATHEEYTAVIAAYERLHRLSSGSAVTGEAVSG